MRRARWLVAVTAAGLGAGLGVAGCGGAAGGSGSGPTRVSAAVDKQVRAVFADYTEAIGARDYERACAHLAAESIANLRKEARRFVDDLPPDCAAVYAIVNGSASAEVQAQVDEVVRTARIDGVYDPDPPRTNVAIIAWAATVDGKRLPIQQPARRIGGDWKLVGAGND